MFVLEHGVGHISIEVVKVHVPYDGLTVLDEKLGMSRDWSGKLVQAEHGYCRHFQAQGALQVATVRSLVAELYMISGRRPNECGLSRQ